jgi:heptosyltransferase-2
LPDPGRILVVQTAFPGDVVLTLPLVQALRKAFPGSEVDLAATPKASQLLTNHPQIGEVIVFDKRSRDSGLGGLLRTAGKIRRKAYGTAIVPHRSLRSAALVLLSRIPTRIGFTTSALSTFLTHRVPYEASAHEVDRNLSLLGPLGVVTHAPVEYPWLYPSSEDKRKVTSFLENAHLNPTGAFVAVAPGTVWNTKRWPEEHFASLLDLLTGAGYRVVLVGGPEDEQLCNRIAQKNPQGMVVSSAGGFTFLQSAELIGRARLLVSNDSAPVHIASAMHTPVVAIFGATVPGFGFAPYGAAHRIVERSGLACRPCSIHGGKKCPISTFECMLTIPPQEVLASVLGLAGPG